MNTADFKKGNDAYSSTFDKGDISHKPARKLAIVACMDCRLHVEEVLGLSLGDCHIIRNAGGRVSEDAIRSLIISQRALGTTEVVVMHHTHCGMATFENPDMVAKVKEDLGVEMPADYDFMSIKGLTSEEAVTKDVGTLKSDPRIPKDIPVHGTIYDVKTGKLNWVVSK